jgi:hypothetical protein
MRKRGTCLLVLTATLAALWSIAPNAGAQRSQSATCKRTFVNGAMHMCGPAWATLSHWRGVTFKNGTCPAIQTGEDAEFTLELGAIAPGKPGNGGLDYLKIQIFGPFSHPSSGVVIAYHGGKRWSGYGESVSRTHTGWSFVASRYATGAGRFTGAFACAKAPVRRPSSAAACPGMNPVTMKGKPGFRFCGPATAVAHVGSRTVRFSGGLCRKVEGAFTVNIGTLVPALWTGKPAYFGVTTHSAKAGRQDDAAVGFVDGGRRYAIAEQVVVLASGLHRGTFSGRVLGASTRVTGSFTC